MDLDAELDFWSDTSCDDEAQEDQQEEEGGKSNPSLDSRAYQLEMFEHSMRGNIIAVVRES